MPLDPSIILSGQLPKFDSPLDMATKALTMKHLAQQGQMQDQAMADDQAMRSAFKNNMTPDANGVPQLNRQAALSDLSKSAPMKAIELKQHLAATDLATMKNQAEQLGLGAQILGSATDQPSWERALAVSQRMGHDISNEPKEYDPNYVKHAMNMAISAKDQLENQFKSYAQNQKDQEIDISKQGLDVRNKEFKAQQEQKQGEAVKDTTQMLISARGDKAYQQAGMDLYAGKKLNGLVNVMGGPDKMNMQMVDLATMEVAKMASGGAPSMHELEGLSPNYVSQKISKLAEAYRNEPTPAKAGAFVRQLQTYANSLMGDAKDVIKTKHDEVLESQKSRLNDINYARLKHVFVNRLDNPQELEKFATGAEQEPAKAGADAKSTGLKVRFGLPQAEAAQPQVVAHPLDSVAMQWAQANPKDPRAAKILQANGQ